MFLRAVVPASGIGRAVVELESMAFGAAPTARVHEGALVAVRSANGAPHRGRDVT